MPDEPRDEEFEDRPRRRRDWSDDNERDSAPPGNPYGVVALILGLAGFVCFFITGIPAIIFGVVGLSRSNRARGAGRGLSIAGLILGVFSLCWTGVAGLVFLPAAVQKVREAAANTKTVNNAKKINLAFIEYHDDKLALPGAIYNPRNKPLTDGNGLSWRVGLLPYMREKALHDSFRLDESWNSPTNAPLGNTIVATYMDVDDKTSATRFQVFVGRGTAFDPVNPRLTLQAFPDGNSNTILFAESATLVPWSRPQDMPYNANQPIPPLGRPGARTFLVGMGDGTVRIVNRNVSPALLHAAIGISEGQPLPADWSD